MLELRLGGDEPPVAAAVLTQQLGVGLLHLGQFLGEFLLLVLQNPDPRVRRGELVHEVPRAAHRPIRVGPGVRLQQPQLALELRALIVRLTSPLLLLPAPLLRRLHLRLQIRASLLRGGDGFSQRPVRVAVLRSEQHELAPVPVLRVLNRHAQRVRLRPGLRVVGRVVPHGVVHGSPLLSLRLEHRRRRRFSRERVAQGLDLLGELGGVAPVRGAGVGALVVEGGAPRGDPSEVVGESPALDIGIGGFDRSFDGNLALHDPVDVLDHLLDDDLGLDGRRVRGDSRSLGRRGRRDDGRGRIAPHGRRHRRVHPLLDGGDDVRLTRARRGPAREVGPEPLHLRGDGGDDRVEVGAQALNGGGFRADRLGQLRRRLGERLRGLLLLRLLLLEDEGGEAELLEGVFDRLVRALVLGGVPLAVRGHARRRALDVDVSLLVAHDLVALHLLLGVPPLALELFPGLQRRVEVAASQGLVDDQLELVHLALHRARRLLHLLVRTGVIGVGNPFQILRSRRPGPDSRGAAVGVLPDHRYRRSADSDARWHGQCARLDTAFLGEPKSALAISPFSRPRPTVNVQFRVEQLWQQVTTSNY